MTEFITTPGLIIISIIAYIFSSIFITRYIINGGKNEKDIILQNKLKATKAKSFLKKYPEADVQTIRNFALAFGFIFAFAGSIFAFSVLGEADKTQVLTGPDTETQTITNIIPPIRTEKQKVKNKIVPPPPPLKKDPNPKVIITKKIDVVDKGTPEPIDTDNEIIPTAGEKEYIEPKIQTKSFVEKMPRFKGCEDLNEKEAYNCTMEKIQLYISTIEYPKQAFDNDIEGKVYVSFIINSKGEVTNVAIAKGEDRSLDNGSLKHLKKMPNFASGGSQGGTNVNVKYVVPIVFKLNH